MEAAPIIALRAECSDSAVIYVASYSFLSISEAMVSTIGVCGVMGYCGHKLDLGAHYTMSNRSIAV